jgi:serine protein kinase
MTRLNELTLGTPGAGEEMSIEDYLDLCARDPSAYDSAEERMLKAFGEPVKIDTKDNPRLSRIFNNRMIRVYPAFSDFYGAEEAIERVVAFFRHAAQGLEERKQVLYLLGPVGGGKSSIAERLKSLMEKRPIYVLKGSPVFESPLGLFSAESEIGRVLSDANGEYKIPSRHLTGLASPWAVKRLDEDHEGDWRKFRVQKIYPSVLRQRAICKVEPGDENNQDISTLVGKVNIRRVDDFDQNDPDSYSFSGGLCIANQGLLEFVEMFKAPLKMLHPLLTATQEGNFKGTEGIGAIPFSGVIVAHSNESEWQAFRHNKANEAFLDRVYIVKIPYTLRVGEERQIYEKMLAGSDLANRPCAPHTLNMMAQWSVLTRLKEPKNSSTWSKLLSYDGDDLKDVDPNAKSAQEYRELADKEGGHEEGMTGSSTRFAFKVLSQVFNFDQEGEIAANPIHLMYVLEQRINADDAEKETKERYLKFIDEYLKKKYFQFVEREIQGACVDSYEEYGQTLFNRYFLIADYWIRGEDYRDPNTGATSNKGKHNDELEKTEKPAGIANPKDFRNEVVNYVLRYRGDNNGKMPPWKSYRKIADVIEKHLVGTMETILPVISFRVTKRSEQEEKDHGKFLERMVAKGYTPKQVRLVSEWYLDNKKSS